jgi:hypothetical protein
MLTRKEVRKRMRKLLGKQKEAQKKVKEASRILDAVDAEKKEIRSNCRHKKLKRRSKLDKKNECATCADCKSQIVVAPERRSRGAQRSSSRKKKS